MMRILLTLFVLFFSSSVFAEDISDFEIEGISIGDNLLDYFNKDQIDEKINHNKYIYLNNPYKFKQVTFIELESFKIYDAIQIIFKNNDKEYKIFGIVGKLMFFENVNECVSRRDQIVEEMSVIFKNVNIKGPYLGTHPADKTGKSTTNSIDFWFNSGDVAFAECYDWSDEMKFYDNLKIGMVTKELDDWLSDYN